MGGKLDRAKMATPVPITTSENTIPLVMNELATRLCFGSFRIEQVILAEQERKRVTTRKSERIAKRLKDRVEPGMRVQM